ncbi:unnamed protein product, partial [Tetraodon nigroviridis]
KQAEPVDESSVKKMILTFEKRSYKNQELRIKFPDSPEKFMESELDLNDIIQEMHVIATIPDLYHLLVELHAVQSLLGLLSHENTDILSVKALVLVTDLIYPSLGKHVAIAVVDLLQELTDIDTLHESEEGAEVLIDALLEGQVVALLVQNMERLDETVKEEADGVHNTLAIVENMAEFRPGLCTEAAQQGLMQWLLKRIKAKMPFDANKLYSSEILAILLQNNDSTRELLGEMDGIDVLLQQLSVFKRHNPSTAEEQEMMENLFDALCSCLMLPANRERFLRGEGLQLMNLMLRWRCIRLCAIYICDVFYDPLYSLFSEHVCSIIASMLRNLKSQQRTRLHNKFTENDCEKVDRLMELYFKYLEGVQQADKRIEGEKHEETLSGPRLTRWNHPAGFKREKRKREGETEVLTVDTEFVRDQDLCSMCLIYKLDFSEMVRRGEILDDDMEDEFYLRRLDAGLFVLQLICYIMVEINNSGISQLQQRVHQILNLRGGSAKIVRHIMREYIESIGDGKSEEYKEAERKRVLDLVENF